MKTLKQLLKIEKCFDEGQQQEIIATVKDWLEQYQCKIKCKNCFLEIQCPYPKLWEDLNNE